MLLRLIRQMLRKRKQSGMPGRDIQRRSRVRETWWPGQGDPKDFLHLCDDTEDTESTGLPTASTPPKRRMEHESDNDDSPDYEPRPN